MDPLPRLHVEADQHAVRTRCTDEGGVHVAESKTAALQGDVVGLVVALVFRVHAALQGDGAGIGVVAEGGGGTLSLSEELHEGRVTQAACYQSPVPF